MSASKAPAYFGLAVAVAAGVLISGVNRNAPSTAAPSLDTASAPAASAAQDIETKRKTPVAWKLQTLNLGPLHFKATLPSSGENAQCMMPGSTDDEVGICQGVTAVDEAPSWQLRIVTQRGRFVPVSWFDNSLQSLRALQPDAVTRQLGGEANAVTKAGFTNAGLLTPIQFPGGLAIRGSASGLPSSASNVVQSCVYAFFLTANRPTTLLYCASTDDESLSGAQKIALSLSKLNPSSEYKRNTAQAAEHATYLKRLKAAGGPAAAPDLAASEQAFEQTVADACGKYSLISQERFQCFEGYAANRLSSL
ncbi:hypothetical protein [Burkholderia pseudomallei]|uniref:hypothetical protein n=1 Tax=Burkholderia pseudomallei TaxID=28450 RepID=UPI0018C549BC|nr:hypothetical protein [Burkholderia pseudomallei]MBG1252535.1 hypothetical protein [Burkholderia pseudomallei]